ncbi:type II transport protein GspH [Aquincola sp. S2]|uniref:Type II secretion system protein H n=1 Tax=Pseudaquabacterium terrae TaxID=2732868 RepID=A0ABX2EQV9_9BURK|nr:GspH/FimT family pseudopilin [Aquabacterium terrae]NRF70901.1 type II transport protein GspH [Aquabacterium terrae]
MSFSHYRTARRQLVRGVSLIETLCAMSIVATTLGLGVPGLTSWHQRQALISSAAELETDIHYARSLAVARNASIRLSSAPLEGGGSCYVLHTGDAHDCRCTAAGEAICENGAQALRLVHHPKGGPVSLSNGKLSIAFNPEHGTVTPTATFRFVDTEGRALHQVVNIMGRTRSCSPGGAVTGVKAC